eukprot:CAMPEP_0197690770 /NCGR_PEP_ID=MMETSP1338-20131121/108801_1 /TAXON_ID=43686 ORGANISM="Pelagodinium beii, Strain RCC1491" /NCGR_SAMPLE_ID=MMETSP1338 /ASSEMBLY_ACC=CAM_ASM_000754 /LENGTH=68 /DNA_ID=CAMNT_0043273251 /DNA_START=181 /DNA_END=384 /DNA_ORIENTATION=-
MTFSNWLPSGPNIAGIKSRAPAQQKQPSHLRRLRHIHMSFREVVGPKYGAGSRMSSTATGASLPVSQG